MLKEILMFSSHCYHFYSLQEQSNMYHLEGKLLEGIEKNFFQESK